MALNISKKRKFIADGVFYSEINEVMFNLHLTRILDEFRPHSNCLYSLCSCSPASSLRMDTPVLRSA